MVTLPIRQQRTQAESLRFQRLGPDIYGASQPQALLNAIREDGEALQDLAEQHVVSIRPFQADTLLQLLIYGSLIGLGLAVAGLLLIWWHEWRHGQNW